MNNINFDDTNEKQNGSTQVTVYGKRNVNMDGPCTKKKKTKKTKTYQI